MTVTSVHRAIQLLRALPRTGGTLSELARETGLAVATVSRLMGTLEEAGAVSRSNKTYRVGPVVMELAGSESAAFDLRSLANGRLHRLRDGTGETAGIAESRGDDIVNLDQVATDHDVSVTDWTGVVVPAHSGCIGFVLMAYWAEDRLARYASAPLERFSAQTLTDLAAIEPLLAEVRRTGWLWTTDHYAVGVTTVAAPVFDRNGAAVASLYVHGPSYRFPSEDDRTSIGKMVRARADEMSTILGHTGGAGTGGGAVR